MVDLNDAECAALLALGARDSWRMNELPGKVDVGLLRRLDTLGLIRARIWIRQNLTQRPEGPTKWGERALDWVSPVESPRYMGSWDKIGAKPQSERIEIRLSDRGRAALDRLLEDERLLGKVKRKRRPNRTPDQKVADEAAIAAHIAKNPATTRREIHDATDIAEAHITASGAWQTLRKRREEARKKNRARATGGN